MICIYGPPPTPRPQRGALLLLFWLSGNLLSRIWVTDRFAAAMKSFLGADGTGIADVWDAHYIKHRKPGVCVRCQWAKNRLKWEPKLPVLLPGWATSSSASAASARLGSTWVLCSRDTKGTYRFACKGCGDIPAFQVKGKRGPDIQKFQRHQQSSAHTRAILNIIDPTAIGLEFGVWAPASQKT